MGGRYGSQGCSVGGGIALGWQAVTVPFLVLAAVKQGSDKAPVSVLVGHLFQQLDLVRGRVSAEEALMGELNQAVVAAIHERSPGVLDSTLELAAHEHLHQRRGKGP
jgi:hypothetical protein